MKEVFSAHQDSSKYSSWYEQFCDLDGLNSSSDLQFLQSLFQTLGDPSNCTNYSWYHHHFHVSQLNQLFSKVQVFVYLFIFFYFLSVIC